MSAATATGTRLGKYSILQTELPGHGLVNLGVLLQDPQADSLRLRLRRDLESFVEEDELDFFEALADDLSRKADELGSEKLFAYFEDTLSGTLRITDRETVLVEDFDRAVDRLYRKHVESKVLEFRTHLPRYSLRAAAGRFLDNEEIGEQGWIEAPVGMQHLEPGMFVAEIVGDSMQPLIPNGSLCVFRAGVVGSRSGRLVLAEDREANAYAVKRYKSEKTKGEEWRHQRIRLESLNPGYPSWDLDADEEKYRIIAEFVRVLD
ncbi:MAG: S24 family peptidase [Bryobacteraceae bacterium]|jgi:SOS-response transcriptional repressor LexA